MEEYFAGLRKIKLRSDNVHAARWPCFYLVSIGIFLGLLLPPLGFIAPLFIYLFLFLLLRLSLSTCPRCGKRFYSLLNIIFNGSFYSKSGMWAVSCNSCGLKLSELPEVDEVTIKSHKDEWFKWATHITNKLCHSLPLAGTQTRARLRHYCTRVCAPYLEVRRHLLTALKSGFNSDIPALRLFR